MAGVNTTKTTHPFCGGMQSEKAFQPTTAGTGVRQQQNPALKNLPGNLYRNTKGTVVLLEALAGYPKLSILTCWKKQPALVNRD